MNVYGSKNLLPNDAQNQVQNGITITRNADGSMIFNGTATKSFDWFTGSYCTPQIGMYTFSINVSDDISGFYGVCKPSYSALRGNDEKTAYYDGTGTCFIYYHFESGVVLSNVKVYPMMRDARISDSTYVPYTLTNKQITDKINAPSNTLIGNPLYFTTDSAQVASDCKIALEPIQAGSGDPSPSNVRAISGYDKVELTIPRKNFIDPNNFIIGLLDGSTGIVDTHSQLWITSGFIGIKGTVTVSGYKDGTESNFCVRFCEYDANKTFIKNTSNINILSDSSYTSTLTLHANTRFVRVTLGFDNKLVTPQTYFATNRVQLELGSTATTYEPYNPVTGITHSLPETVYGGTLDVETGEYINGCDIRNLDEVLSWTYQNFDGAHIFYINGTAEQSLYSKVWCSHYKGGNKQWNNLNNLECTGNANGFSGGNKIIIRDDNYSDATAFANSLTGAKLVYELDKQYKKTIHLTPAQVNLLKGTNTVTTNGTTITLKYRDGELAKLEDLSGIAESINKLGERTFKGYVSINTDGVKTWGNLLTELLSKIDINKLSSTSSLVVDTGIAKYNNKIEEWNIAEASVIFSRIGISNSKPVFYRFTCHAQYPSYYVFNMDGTKDDRSSVVPSSGFKLVLFY